MNKHNGKLIKKFGKHELIFCRNCNFIHVNPIPSNDELLNFYKNMYYQKNKPDYIKGNEKDIEYQNYTFDEKLDFLEKNCRKGKKRILDIGSGPGFFLRRAKKRGWEVLGVEPSSTAYEYSSKQKIPTIQKFFHQVEDSELGKFDSIHTFDVLEHVNDPINILKRTYSLLKKNGIIVIEVPNDFNPLQNIIQKKLKKDEYWVTLSSKLHKFEHLNYFDFSSISKLVERIGFKIISKESTFPLEFFILMGQDYIKNPKIGKKIHSQRVRFEENSDEIKKLLYKKFAEIGIGRTAIIYAKK